MNDQNSHTELENAVAAYALGAAGEESESIEHHIKACASCRELEARLRRAVGALPLVAEEVRPPQRLRARILAAAASGQNAAAPEPPRRPAAPVISLRARRPFWVWSPGPAAAVAALTLAVAGLFAWDLSLSHQIGQGRVPASHARHVSIAGQQAMVGAHIDVTELPGSSGAVASFSGMPPVEEGRVYEVWLIAPGAGPRPAAVFTPDAGGTKTIVLPDLSGYRQIAVTVEQGPGGVTAPTSTPALAGNLA